MNHASRRLLTNGKRCFLIAKTGPQFGTVILDCKDSPGSVQRRPDAPGVALDFH
jgi:hypothetical protein